MHQYPTYAPEETGLTGMASRLPVGARKVSTGTGMRIEWQEGPFSVNGPNGAMLELPVRALLHRVADLNEHLPCPQNGEITRHLNAILGLLDDRTRERNGRGVLGTTMPL